MIKEIIEFVRNSGVVALTVATPLFMVANILGGTILADFKDEWDPEVLKTSLIKYVSILIMGALIYTGGKLSNEALVELLDVDLKLDFIVAVGLATLTGKYAKDAVVKFVELTGVKVNHPEIEAYKNTAKKNLVVEIDADTSKITEKLEALVEKTEEITNE